MAWRNDAMTRMLPSKRGDRRGDRPGDRKELGIGEDRPALEWFGRESLRGAKRGSRSRSRLASWMRGVTLCGLLWMSGCAADKNVGIPVPDAPSPDKEYRNGDRYFHYLLAQMKLRDDRVPEGIADLEKAVEADAETPSLLLELAMIYAQTRDTSRSMSMVEKILASHPDNLEAMDLYGRLKQAAGSPEEARDIYERMLELDPRRKDVYVRLGPIYMDAGDYDNAWRVYHQLVERFPDAYVGYFFLGRIHAERGEYKEAETAFLQTIAIAPELEEPRYELLSLYEAQGLNQKVVDTYERLMNEDPGNLRAALGLGYHYYRTGKLRRSESILAELGRDAATNEEIPRAVAQLYLETKKYDAAIVILEMMLRGAPDSSELHYLTGVAFDGIGDMTGVIEHFSRVAPDSRFYKNTILHMAFLYQDRGERAKGIALLESARPHLTNVPDFYLYLAAFQEQEGNIAAAEATLEEGIRNNPENDALVFRVGVLADKRGDKEEAVARMKRAIELNPKSANALNYLGYTYAELGRDLDEAERLILEAIQNKPDDGYIIDSLGWVYYKKGDYAQALTWLLKSVSLVGDDPVILEHLGDTYLKLNDIVNALKYYEKSLEHREGSESASQQDLPELMRKIERLRREVKP